MPQYDGLAFGLASMGRSFTGSSSDINLMSRSFAGFHLNAGRKHNMAVSVDKLFEDGVIDTQSSIIIEDSSQLNTPVTPKIVPRGVGTPPPSPKVIRTSTPNVNDKPPSNVTPSPLIKEQQVRDSSAELYKVGNNFKKMFKNIIWKSMCQMLEKPFKVAVL